MKKIIALLLAVLYITTTSGVVLNVHYCMGKISSVKVDNFSVTMCTCGKKLSNNSCCRTEIKVVKLSNDHKSALTSLKVKVSDIPVFHPVSLVYGSKIIASVPPYSTASKPPGVSVKTYLRNCVFRV